MIPYLLVIHALATWFMTGLIWLVQLVHYPLMASVGRAHFACYEAKHQRRIGPIVAIVMPVELGSATVLALVERSGGWGWLAWPSLLLVIILWLSTALVQVPLHATLSAGFNASAHRRLVRSNWLRTAVWSSRSLVAAIMLLAAIPA